MSKLGVQGEEISNPTPEINRYLRKRSMRLLGELLGPLKARLSLAIILVLCAQAAKVAGPAIIAYAIDTVLPQASTNVRLVWLTGLAYVGAALIAGLCSAAYIRVSAWVSQDALVELRKRVFAHTQNLSIGFHETYTSGRIISRQTSDVEALRDLLDNGITQLFQSMLFMVLTGLSLFLLDWRTGIVITLAIIPIALLIKWYRTRAQRAHRESRVASARLIVDFVENMTGIKAVQAFRKEDEHLVRHDHFAREFRRAHKRPIRLNGILDPGINLVGNLTLSVALAIGAFRVFDGDLTVGVLVAALLYIRRFFQPIQQMTMVYNSFQSASAALEKISGVLEEEPDVVEPTDPASVTPRGRLELTDVSFSYATGPQILSNMNLSISPGTTIALVGETGAGKSTLAKLIARFYDPTSGAVRLDGHKLTDIADADLRSAIVMVTQEAFLFSGSVADNIGLSKPGASREEIIAAGKAVGAHDFIMELPDGYDTDVNKRGGRLSAGQRQLVSFARVFLADPAVLVLDEATSSLDIPGERLVQQGLEKLLANRTAIIIAHRLSTVAIADRVLVMDKGRIKEDGTPAQLLGSGGTFAELHAAWKDTLV